MRLSFSVGVRFHGKSTLVAVSFSYPSDLTPQKTAVRQRPAWDQKRNTREVTRSNPGCQYSGHPWVNLHALGRCLAQAESSGGIGFLTTSSATTSAGDLASGEDRVVYKGGCGRAGLGGYRTAGISGCRCSGTFRDLGHDMTCRRRGLAGEKQSYRQIDTGDRDLIAEGRPAYDTSTSNLEQSPYLGV